MIFRDTDPEHTFFCGQSQSSIRASPETITLSARYDPGAIRGSSQCVGGFPQPGGKRNQLSIIRDPGAVRANGMWTENSIYAFSGSNGSGPLDGVIFDSAGNLYGTTYQGGRYGEGTIFQLSPSMGWTESVLHSFGYLNDGGYPHAGLIPDQSGNLYGATSDFAPGGGGLVFELSPSGDSWTYLNVYNLSGTAFNRCGPWGNLAVDAAGNLYGTTFCDGPNKLGSVFKLTFSGGRWIYTSLHDFTGGNDGANPISNVVIDANGNLYGTASVGGALGYGVVWEITP